MSEPLRVTPEEVYPRVQSGESLLVCAYDDDAKFRRKQLEGAISLAAFRDLLPGMAKDKEIVFYCG